MKSLRFSYVLLIMTLLTLLIIAGCVPNDDTTQDIVPDIEDVTDKADDTDVIKIGAISFPPNYYFEDSEFKGSAAEIVIEAFSRMGVEFEIKEYPWPRMMEMLKTGELDIIIDVQLSEERSEFLDFSSEKLISYNDAFFKLTDSDIAFNGDFNELSEYTIGTVQSFYYGNSFAKAVEDGIIKVEEASTFEQSILKLLNHRMDLIVNIVAVGEKAIDDLGYSDMIEPLEPYINSEDSYIAFSKVNNLKELRDLYDETIRKMHEDGTIEAIYNKY